MKRNIRLSRVHLLSAVFLVFSEKAAAMNEKGPSVLLNPVRSRAGDEDMRRSIVRRM